jgi:hypothetical protein
MVQGSSCEIICSLAGLGLSALFLGLIASSFGAMRCDAAPNLRIPLLLRKASCAGTNRLVEIH